MNIDFSSINKILIVQYKPFGDVLLNTGYLPFLREKFKSAKIDFLVSFPYHKAIENNPFIDELILFKQGKGISYFFQRVKLFFTIYHKKYDLVIDQMRGTGSSQITFFSKAKYRLGFENARFSFFYNIRAKQKSSRYSASMKFDLLEPLGITEQPFELYYYINKSSRQYINDYLKKINPQRKKIICFSPGSPVPAKQWSLKNYAALGDLLISKSGHLLIIIWGPGELDDVKKIVSVMQNKPEIAIPTDFNQAAALLGKSEILVCNDGGINHLCCAVGTKSLALFGNTDPINWVPENSIKNQYIYKPDFISKNDPSFGISPQEVFDRLKTMLQF